MTLKDFAIKLGYESVRCDKNEWGGTWGFRFGAARYLGYRTEAEAVNAFIEEKFGEDSSKAFKLLLNENKRLRERLKKMNIVLNGGKQVDSE